MNRIKLMFYLVPLMLATSPLYGTLPSVDELTGRLEKAIGSNINLRGKKAEKSWLLAESARATRDTAGYQKALHQLVLEVELEGAQANAREYEYRLRTYSSQEEAERARKEARAAYDAARNNRLAARIQIELYKEEIKRLQERKESYTSSREQREKEEQKAALLTPEYAKQYIEKNKTSASTLEDSTGESELLQMYRDLDQAYTERNTGKDRLREFITEKQKELLGRNKPYNPFEKLDRFKLRKEDRALIEAAEEMLRKTNAEIKKIQETIAGYYSHNPGKEPASGFVSNKDLENTVQRRIERFQEELETLEKPYKKGRDGVIKPNQEEDDLYTALQKAASSERAYAYKAKAAEKLQEYQDNSTELTGSVIDTPTTRLIHFNLNYQGDGYFSAAHKAGYHSGELEQSIVTLLKKWIKNESLTGGEAARKVETFMTSEAGKEDRARVMAGKEYTFSSRDSGAAGAIETESALPPAQPGANQGTDENGAPTLAPPHFPGGVADVHAHLPHNPTAAVPGDSNSEQAAPPVPFPQGQPNFINGRNWPAAAPAGVEPPAPALPEVRPVEESEKREATTKQTQALETGYQWKRSHQVAGLGALGALMWGTHHFHKKGNRLARKRDEDLARIVAALNLSHIDYDQSENTNQQLIRIMKQTAHNPKYQELHHEIVRYLAYARQIRNARMAKWGMGVGSGIAALANILLWHHGRKNMAQTAAAA